jgi:hypothetical protein
LATAYAPAPDETPDGGVMSDEELATFLAEHETRSIGYYESEIASDQADAIDRYYRRPYGDERDGRSQVVDATVAITVDNALAAILKPFVSSDETVVFEPKGPEDVEQAEQATDYVNYVLHNDNCGFQLLHDWFKDALLSKLGVVKVYWEDYSREKVERIDQLDAMQIEQMAEDIVDVYGPDENGLYTADVRKTEQDGKCCIENVPPEEYRISPLARPGRKAPYEAHITAKPRSDLIEMGFDAELVDTLPASAHSVVEDSRTQARYNDEDYVSAQLTQPGDKSRELVQVNDEYVLVDYDGDGVSELRHVIRVNNVILFNEEVEECPFARLCPVPMPHKIYGQSLADQVIDEQRIATVITRQTLDNIYLANNPRVIVPENAERDDGSTVDDLNQIAPGAPLRVKNPEGFGAFAVPFVADKSFPMLAYIGQQAEARTGISKRGQGMDPDAIDKAGQISATQAAIMEEGQNERSELIARIFAETGVKDLFRKILRLLVEHQPRSRVIRLRNKWVEMDPRGWNADMDLSISVGLGIGNKAQQIAVADGILQTIAMAKQDPAASTLFPLEKVYNAIKRKLTAAGIKNVDEFIQEPQRDEQGNVVEPELPPDPRMMEAQAKLQIEQAKHEHKVQVDTLTLQQKTAEAMHKLEMAGIQAATKQHLEEQKAAFEADLAERQFAFEAKMALLEAQLADARAARDQDRADRETDANISKNREGGDLSK